MTDDHALDLSSVALFPLPSVVLFPRAVLPLHIFEDRYRAMSADALVGDRCIAMALLKPGWEKNYYAKPQIEPVVCVGRILSHEKLADGKYNFLLQGVARARIVRELPGEKPYRVAQLHPVEQVPAMEIELERQRQQMTELFSTPPLSQTGPGKQFRQIVRSHLPTAEIADLAAFTFIEDVALKQSLLADADIRGRTQRTIDAIVELSRSIKPGQEVRSAADPNMN